MAKYTSDTNLIRGAAAAHRDYSNMPGMYSGLDKLTKAGSEMVQSGMIYLDKYMKMLVLL